MGFGYDAKGEAERLNSLRDAQYDNYCNEMSTVKSKYMELRDRYNHKIAAIDHERASMRNEIRALEKFLHNIGGKLADKITIFDFKEERAPEFQDCVLLAKPDRLYLEEKHVLTDSLMRTLKISMTNKSRIDDYEVLILAKKSEYDQNILLYTSKLKLLEDAVEIADIYFQVVVLVRDAIKEKIIPELGLINAFLYAETLKEHVIDEAELTEVIPVAISECEGTAQDVHYQFVKNVFDFYTIATNFFKNPVLTSIIEDMQVTEEEKNEFNSNIENIKDSIKRVEEKKVL